MSEDDGKELANPLLTPASSSSVISYGQATKDVLKEAWPYVVSRLFTLQNFLMVYILGRTGVEQYEAGPLIASTQLFANAGFSSVLFSVAIFTSQKVGANNTGKLNQIAFSGLIMSLLLSLLGAGFNLASAPVLSLIGQNQTLTQITGEYYYFAAAGMPGFMALTSWQQFLLGIGQPITLLISMAALASSIAFFGFLFSTNDLLGVNSPFANLAGSQGMGLAYTISNWLVFFGLMAHILCHKKYAKYKLCARSARQNTGQHMRQMFCLGFPIALQIMAELITTILISIMSGIKGPIYLAATATVDQLLSVAIVMSIGFAQTSGTLVSRHMGDNNAASARRTGLMALATSSVVAVLCTAIFCAFGRKIAGLMVANGLSEEDTELYLTTCQYLFYIDGISELFDYPRHVAAGNLRGYHVTKSPMIISIGGITVLGMSLSVLLGFETPLGIYGIYLGRAIGIALASISVAALYEHTSRKAAKTALSSLSIVAGTGNNAAPPQTLEEQTEEVRPSIIENTV